MSALRECPGCGSFSMPYLSKRREGVWRVACDECGFAGPVDDTEAGAIAAWNRRATPAEVEALRDALRIAIEALDAADMPHTADAIRAALGDIP